MFLKINIANENSIRDQFDDFELTLKKATKKSVHQRDRKIINIQTENFTSKLFPLMKTTVNSDR